MNFKFCPNPEEEDLRFHKLHYCFGGDGDGGSGGASSGSGMSPAAAGEAGASDNAGEGMGDYGSESASADTSFTDANLDAIAESFDMMNSSSYSVSGMGGGITGFDSMADATSFAEFNQAEAQFEALNNATGFVGMNSLGVVQDMQTISPTGYSRASYEDAAFFADITNQNFNFDQAYASTFMSDPTVVNAESGFIGQVTSDNSLVDAAINFFNPVPMMTVDTAQVIDATGKTSGTYSLTQAGVTGYGNAYGQMVSEAEAAGIQAAQQSAAEAGLSGGADKEYVASVQSASPYKPKTVVPTTPFRSRVRASAMSTPSATMMYSDTSDPFGYFSYLNPTRTSYLFAEGGDVDAQMLEIQNTGTSSQPTGDGPTGFVEAKPESLDDGTKVADDVPVDVEDGSFVINAAAVEFAGSEDIKKMLVDAISEARRQGIDISGDENKIDRENAVSLLVSRGEVVVPPILAKIIGYDKLNKINNRGKPETEKRLAENGQEQPANPAEGTQMAAMGMDVRDTDVIDIYSSIQSQGGEPGTFDTFRDAMDLYKGTKTYRPMAAQPGTPEFDMEVRDRYKVFFSDNPNPYMDKAARDAAAQTDKANMIDESLPIARERPDGTIYYIDRSTGKEVPAPKDSGDEGFVERTPAP